MKFQEKRHDRIRFLYNGCRVGRSRHNRVFLDNRFFLDYRLLADRHENNTGIPDLIKEMFVHVMPSPAILQLHQVFLAAVNQYTFIIIGKFGYVAQHVHRLFLVGHIGHLDQLCKAFPRDKSFGT